MSEQDTTKTPLDELIESARIAAVSRYSSRRIEDYGGDRYDEDEYGYDATARQAFIDGAQFAYERQEAALDRIRAVAIDVQGIHEGNGSTHYETCYLFHAGCFASLILGLADEGNTDAAEPVPDDEREALTPDMPEKKILIESDREALVEIIGHVFYNSHLDPTGHTADAILTAGFRRPIPDLDPEPWLCTFRYCETPGLHREAIEPTSTEIAWAFKPREEYEQDRARYDKELQ